MGVTHAKAAARSGSAELVAVADTDLEKARRVTDLLSCGRTYGSHVDLLSDDAVEAVVVAVPTPLHHPIALEALAAGKHVLLEKPPARSAAEAVEMRDAATSSGKVLMFGYQRRHEPVHRRARAMIRDGALGKLYYGRAWWFCFHSPEERSRHCFQWSTRGASMAALGSHHLDWLLWLMGYPEWRKVTAWAHRDLCRQLVGEDPGDDLMAALVWLEGDMVIQLEASRRAHRTPGRCAELYGETGSYSEECNIFRGGGKDTTTSEPVLDQAPDWQQQWHHQMAHFVRAIRGGAEADMGVDDAVKLQSLLDAIYLSAETGETVANPGTEIG